MQLLNAVMKRMTPAKMAQALSMTSLFDGAGGPEHMREVMSSLLQTLHLSDRQQVMHDLILALPPSERCAILRSVFDKLTPEERQLLLKVWRAHRCCTVQLSRLIVFVLDLWAGAAACVGLGPWHSNGTGT